MPGEGGAAKLCDWSVPETSQSQSSLAPPSQGITLHTHLQGLQCVVLKCFAIASYSSRDKSRIRLKWLHFEKKNSSSRSAKRMHSSVCVLCKIKAIPYYTFTIDTN
ncbi:hypothetical protein Y032_0103g3572 [Ancylostoma ceylanicum]|uniref:Uncharacterized protein n=1 Tax=Ancylostoma ceylanicum TaxID=53326 RepID=A0A016TH40_9BILA|nr:hypothetical protein Y032_0103g3572 [Ancylostoma ceylanicum]